MIFQVNAIFHHETKRISPGGGGMWIEHDYYGGKVDIDIT